MKTANRRVVAFVVSVVVTYTVLMLPVPAVGKLYSTVFRSCGNAALGLYRGRDALRFDEIGSSNGPALKDSEFIIRAPLVDSDRRGSVTVSIETDSRFLVFSPLALFLALCLSTRTSWRRRGRGLLIGLPLIFAFILVRFALLGGATMERQGILNNLDLDPFFGLLREPLTGRWGATARRSLLDLESTVNSATLAAQLPPLMIWGLAMLDRGGLGKFRRLLGSAPRLVPNPGRESRRAG